MQRLDERVKNDAQTQKVLGGKELSRKEEGKGESMGNGTLQGSPVHPHPGSRDFCTWDRQGTRAASICQPPAPRKDTSLGVLTRTGDAS